MEAPAAAKPRTVAGPTKPAASALARSPDALTLPAMAATTGWVASCAASGTATDSAMIIGSQRFMIIAQRRAHQTMPALASTDKTKPTDRLRNGSTASKITAATLRLRSPARRAPDPSAARATRPIAAARSTLGSVRHRPTKVITPSSPIIRSHQPRTPTQRPNVSRKASNRVRFAPDTAVRWVRPVSLKSSVSSGVIADVSPSTRAGTSARGSLRRCATESRSPCRTRLTSRSGAAGCCTRRGAERTRRIAARSDPRSGLSSRPETSTRLPTGSRDHGSSAAPVITTSTGACKWLVSPRPATSTSVARAVPYAPRTALPPEACRSVRIISSAETAACWPASIATGPVLSRYASAPPRPASPAIRMAAASHRAERRSTASTEATATPMPAAAQAAGVCQVPSHAAAQAAPASGTIRRSRSLTPGRVARSARRSWVRCHPPPEAPRPG